MEGTDVAQSGEQRSAEAGLWDDLRDCLDELVWSTSTDGRQMLFINRAAERVYGRPLDELREDPLLWRRAIHADDRGAVEQALSELPQRGRAECGSV